MLNELGGSGARQPTQRPRLNGEFSGVAFGLALLALAGWLLDARLLAGQWMSSIPMAPSTAVSLLLLAGGIICHARWASRKPARYAALLCVVLSISLGVLVLAQFLGGFDSGVERILTRTNEFFGEIPLGRMSPLTAASLLLESIALLLLLRCAAWRFTGYMATLLALPAVALNVVVLVGYLYGAPLLYGSATIPVAAPTALAFVLIGTELLAQAILQVPKLRAWSGDYMRGILLRAFLPATLLLILLEGWLDAVQPAVAAMNQALWHSLMALLACVLFAIIIAWTARRTGDAIERAQESLRESEERYRTAIQTAMDGYWLTDSQGRFLDVSETYCRMTGYSAEELMSMRIADIEANESSADTSAHIQRIMARGEDRFESRHRRKDGSTFDVEVSAQFRPAAGGRFVVFLRDITEHKLYEADRETMLDLFRLLSAPNDTHNLIQTVTGLLQDWSGCDSVGIRLQEGEDFPYFETRGFPAEFVQSEKFLCARDANNELMRDRNGDPFLECMCGNILCGRFDPRRSFFTVAGSFWTNSTTKLLASTTDADRQSRTRNRCNGEGFESVALIPLRSSGRTIGLLQLNDRRPGRFTPQKIALMERAAGSLAIAMEQRMTQKALRASEERYRLISENTADVIWLIDAATGQFTYVSPSVERLLGYSPEEIMALPVAHALTPESYRKVVDSIQERLAACEAGDLSAHPRITQVDQTRKDGSAVRTEVMTTLLVNSQGRVAEVLGVTRDITERLHAETRLAQAQKMESIGRLAGGVAHDFNNLLTVINGYSRLLLGEMEPKSPLRLSIEEINSAGERAAGLTRQLLAFSRKQVLQPRNLNVNLVVGGMRLMLQRMVGDDVEVRVELNAAPGIVYADPHQLEQVIMNLTVNARDAMPGGGHVVIETAEVERDESYARAHPGTRAGRHVMLAVRDNGVGMDEETRQRIFEPFFTTKGAGKGTGLGLSMVQGIVTQSGGGIEVFSERGQGTTFKIYLPALAEAVADTAVPAPIPARGGTETVLVVEDQLEVRKYAVEVLMAKGYRVIAAESAGEALEFCKRGQVDLVLTDVVMPNVSGLELAGRLEQLQSGIKVLFMSGYADSIIGQNEFATDREGFIQKPFSPDELAGKVRAMLGPPGTHVRILLAEGDDSVRGFLRMVLQGGGYAVIEAADAKQALGKAEAEPVDLVILDLAMRGQIGRETIQVLRRSVPEAGIIAVSDEFGGPAQETAMVPGADALLCKPVNAAALLARVAEVLKLRG